MKKNELDINSVTGAIHLAEHVLYMESFAKLAQRDDLPDDVRNEVFTALRADVLFTDEAIRAKIDAHFGNKFDRKLWLSTICTAFLDGANNRMRRVADIIEGLNRAGA